MPSPKFVEKIEQSLAQGESYDDFAYLFDALTRLRRPYIENQKLSEEVVGKLLCVLTPDKPPKYRRAMQEFRLQFAHVSVEPVLQAEFFNCVKTAALAADDPNNISWIPSLYFKNAWRVPRGRYAKLQHWY